MKWIVHGTMTKTGKKGRWGIEAPNRVDAELRAAEAGVEVDDVRPATEEKSPTTSHADVVSPTNLVNSPSAPAKPSRRALSGASFGLAGICLVIGIGIGFFVGKSGLVNSAQERGGRDSSNAPSSGASALAHHQGDAKADLISLLGLPAGTKDQGVDSLGRHWFDVPALSGTSRSDGKPGSVAHWAYERKTGNIFRESRDAGGKSTLVFVRRGPADPPDPVASLLALGPEAMDNGTDTLGRRWFKVPATQPTTASTSGSPELQDWCYDPKTGTLYQQVAVPNEEPKLEVLRQIAIETADPDSNSSK